MYIPHTFWNVHQLQTPEKNILGLQRPYIEDKDRTIAAFLLFGHKTEGTICWNRDDLQKLLQHRSKILH